MFSNIGKKIKGLAVGLFVLMSIASIIVAFVLLDALGAGFFLLVLFGGPLVSWILSWMMYGYGELIDKVSDIKFKIVGEDEEYEETEEEKRQRRIQEIRARNASEEKARRQTAQKGKKEPSVQSSVEESQEEFVSVEFEDIKCPFCYEILSFEKGTVDAECPFCDSKFKIEK